MFYSLNGIVLYADETSVAIDCGGVGYLCFTTANTLRQLPEAGNKALLYTYLNVREDAMDLFGFSNKKELDCFKQLISISGVGPKAALAVLSQLTPEALSVCVATGDAKSITRAQGVGAKLAQRIVLELKDKLKIDLAETVSGDDLENARFASEDEHMSEAVSALVMLGYNKSEAAVAVGKLDSTLTTEELIKQALRKLSKA